MAEKRRVVYYKRPQQVAAEVRRQVAIANIPTEEVADELGYKRSYLNLVMTGQRPPSEKFERRFTERFGTDPSVFEKWTEVELGSMIKVARIELGLTAREFAETAGVSTRELTSLETGERYPNRRTLEKIACLLCELAHQREIRCNLAFVLMSIVRANGTYEVQS